MKESFPPFMETWSSFGMKDWLAKPKVFAGFALRNPLSSNDLVQKIKLKTSATHSVLLTFLFSCMAFANVFAEANYVYHEATTSNPGCGANNYRSVLTPNSSQPMVLAWKIEFLSSTTQTWVYYTTDGSTPSGSIGVGSGTTQVLTGSYSCVFGGGGGPVDVATATIPARPAGTTVKYIIGAWHNNGAGSEIFANGGPPGCSGCGAVTIYASLATVFSYTVTQPPTITSFTPTSGAVGTTVTITGTGFNTTAANNIVYFGGVKATVSAATATSLTVTVPASTNYGPISVTNTASKLSAYSKAFFSATKSPAKTSLTTGEFVASSSFSLGGGTWAMTASEGDFNNDGLLDVAVADYNNASSISVKVFPNSSTSGTINFGTAVGLSSYAGTRGLSSADLDGDGKLELISVGTGTAKVSIFPNNTSGATISFGTKIDLTINGGAYYALAADFNGDGKIDIACANNSVVSIFLNTTTTVGSITFASKVDFATAAGCIGLGVGDINGDGLPDLVTGNTGNNTTNMSVLRNTTSSPGSLSFATKVDFAISSTTTSSYLNLADFDGDGNLDVAISNGNTRSISLFKNTSSGSSITFNSPYNLSGTFSNIGLGVGDINGDGLPDVAAADGGNWIVYLNNSTSGTISFSSVIGLSLGVSPWDASIADLDGDGRGDVFGGNGGTDLRAFRYVPTFSSNANLSALTTTAGTIAPTFATATTSYTVSVANATASVTVTPTKADATATIQVRVNGGTYATVASGTASSALALNVGTNPIDVRVTAEDGTTIKTYTITVTRAAINNADLSAMTLSAGTLSPTFAAATTTYSTSTSVSASSVTVTPTAVNVASTIQVRVNGGTYATVASGSASAALSLILGSNAIDVKVTAEDGTTIKTYTITVTRIGNALHFDGTDDFINVPNTSNISLTSGDFTLETWVKTTVNSINVILGKGNGGNSYWFGLSGGKVAIAINGATLSSSATVNDGNWHHIAARRSGTTTTVLVDGVSDGTSTSLTGNPSNADPLTIARFAGSFYFGGILDDIRIWNIARTDLQISSSRNNELFGNESGLGAYFKLNEGTAGGTNTGITTAADATPNANNGSLGGVFALTASVSNWVAGNVGAAIPSTDATLSALTTTAGTISPTFAAATTSYTASVANGTASVTVTPTKADANATIQVRVNGGTYATVASGAASTALALNAGSNTIDVKVTAQDGTTIKTYTLSVCQVPLAPTGTATQNFYGSSTVASLTATGTAIQWYAAASGGSPLPSNTPLVSGTHYYASQTVNGCESSSRLDVTATRLATTFYVMPTTVGTGDALSWANASSNLQSVITNAISGDQIWVSTGTYKPTVDPSGASNARRRTFLLKSGVKLYGGFVGTETLLSQRDFNTNVTTLSGDFNGDDGANFANNTENAYIVVMSVGCSNTTGLDGFKITGGNTNSNSTYLVSGYTVEGNSGGGMQNGGNSSFTVSNCTFTLNKSSGYAGGIYNNTSPMTYYKCLISANESGYIGTGMFSWGQFGVTTLNINNCVFLGNISGASCGGLVLRAALGVCTNTLFINNSGIGYGSGLFSFGDGSAADINNCTFYGNTAPAGNNSTAVAGPSCTIRNSIFWNNTGGDREFNCGSSTINNCVFATNPNNVITIGTGNVTGDPYFVNTSNLIGADGLWGTADDGLRIGCGSSAYNAANNTTAISTDIVGVIRPQLTTADAGAYESGISLINTAITINTHPQGATYCQNTTASALSISASGSGLTYQWYSNASNSNTGGTLISGAINSTYTPSTTALGTIYYYCVVNSASGCYTATPSNTAAIVTNITYIAVVNNGNWSSASTWSCNTVPPVGADVIIDATGVTLSSNVTVHSITVNTGKSITHSSNKIIVQSGGFITNNGTFTSTAIVDFLGTATVSGSVLLSNVYVRAAVDFGSNSTVDGLLYIYYGGSVVNRPTYGNLSGLLYTGAGTIVVGNEWPTGNINLGSLYVSSGTVLDFGTISTSRQVGGGRGTDIYQNDGTINLSSVSGGDLILESVYLYNAGTLNANQRTVTIQGPSNHHIQNSGSGITFYNLVFGAGGSINVPLTVTNNLNLTAGCTMDLNSSVTLESGATNTNSGSGRLNMVNGNGFVKIKNITTARTFPLARGGFSSSYTPLTISNGQGLDYTVKMNSTNPSGGTLSAYTATRTFKGQWDITPSAAPASPVTLAFQYNNGDLLSGTNTQSQVLTHYVGGQWTEVTGNVATPTGTNPYTVSFAYSGTFSPFSFGGTPSNNADLSALTTTAGTIAPTFAAATTAYTASVANGTASVTVTPTKADANATIQVRVNGGTYATVASGAASAALALNVGANPIDVQVTAENGTTIKTYTITVTRAPSSVATLSAMTLSSGTLSPTFAAATTSYTASVTSSASTITVTPTSSHSGATIQVQVNSGGYSSVTSGSASSALALNFGANTIQVKVTAQDGTTTITYTTTVTRANYTAVTNNGNWNTASTWDGNAVPPSGADVIIDATGITVSSNVTVRSITVNTGKSITHSSNTLNVQNGFITNNGTFTSNAAVGISGTVTVSGIVSFTDVHVQGSIDFGSNSTLNGQLVIYYGGSVVNRPTYGNTSGLFYTGAGTIFVGNEWPTGNINIGSLYVASGTVLDFGTISTPRQLGTGRVSDVYQNDGTINLSSVSGGDLILESVYLYNAGTLNTNQRTVTIQGGNSHHIQNAGSGITFYNLVFGATGSINIPLTVTNNLNLTAGCNMDINNTGSVTLESGATNTSAGSGRFNMGNSNGFVKIKNITTARTFPLARFNFASSYTPLTISNGQGLDYTVKMNSTNPSGGTLSAYTAARTFKGQWDITPSAAPASPVTLAFQYNNGDLLAGTNTQNQVLTHYVGGQWTEVTGNVATPTGTNPYTVSFAYSGTFSPFSFGGTPSTNADLSALTTTAGTIAPTFAAATTSYTASVANATASVTVTPTKADANATIQVRVNGGTYATVTSGAASAALALNVGANPIDVKVTAEDGTTIKTYTISVCRLPIASISANNGPICSGSDATFTLTGSSDATVTYNINGGANTTATLTGGTAIITLTAPSANQTLNLVDVSHTGCASTLSGSSTVVVNNPSVAPASISGTSTICNGGSTTLTAVGGTLGTGANYQWGTGSVVGSNIISGQTTSTLSITPTTTTTYWVRIVNTTSPCTATTGGVTQAITVNEPSVAPTSITGTSTICNGSSTTLTAVGGTLGTGANYQWGTGSVVGTNPLSGETAATLTVSPTSATTYWVRIENGASPCVANTSGVTQAVTVNEPSVAPASISGTSTICNGSATTLTAVGGTLGTGANYQWGTGSVAGTTPLVGETAATLTISPTSTTTYWVRIENGTSPCAANTSGLTQAVTVNNPSVAPTSISGTSTICNGSATTLTAVGGTVGTGANYQWGTGSVVGTNPLSGETAATLTVSPTSATTYWVRIENGASPCVVNTSGATQAVTVNTRPTSSIIGTQTICNGNSINLFVLLTGTAPWSLTYTDGTTPVTVTGISSSPNSFSISPSASSTYTISALSDAVCTAQAGDRAGSAVITINYPPSITTAAASNSPICAGTTLNLSVAASGTTPLTYAWAGTGTFTNGTTATPTVTGAATGNYIATISNGCGSVSSIAAVTVNTPSVAPTSITGTNTICNGSSTTLTAAGGTLGTGANYQWGTGSVVGTNPLAGQTTATLSVSPTSTTTYWVRIENGTSPCAINTSGVTQTVTVNNPSVAPTSITGTSTICNGGSTTLTAAGGTLGTGANYQWGTGSTVGANPLAGETAATLSISPTSTTTYWVRIENGASPCTANTSGVMQTITVSNPSVAPTSITGTSAICNGGSTTLTAVGGTLGTGANYQWGIGSVAGTNPLTGETAATFTVAPTSTTTYWVRIENTATSCAANTSGLTQAVTVNARPTSTTIGTQTICNGNSANMFVILTGSSPWNLTYTDGAGPVTVTGITTSPYSFTKSPSTTTTYTVTALSDALCTSQAGDRTGSAVITVNNPSVAPSSIVGTTTICDGGSTTLVALGGTLGTGANYQWGTGSTVGTNPLAGETSASLTISPTFTTTYWVRIENTAGPCAGATAGVTETVTVNIPSIAPTAITGTSTICNGDVTTLTVVGGTLGTGASYKWGLGSVVGVNPASGQTGASIFPAPSTTTTYWVRIENTAGPCPANTSGLTQTVTVNNFSLAPTVILGTNTICDGGSITLTAGGGALGTGANYQWGTGSAVGTSPLAGETAATLSVSPTSTTTYWVRIENTTGPCTATTNGVTQVVTVNPLPTASITANNSPVCSGTDATFTLTGTADAVVSYTLNGTAGTATLTGGTATVTATSVTSDRVLVLTSVNNPITNCSQSITGTSTVTVNTTPTVNATPASQSICPSGTITDIALTNPNSVSGTVLTWSRDNTTVLTGIGSTGTGASISGSLASTTPGTFATTTFTVTATANGCSTNTTATVSVGDVIAPVADVTTLSNVTGECSATATAPTATDNCVGSVTATTSDPLSYSVQGTYTIHWTYNDGNGNTSTQNQTVIVNDVTAPVADVTTLSNITGECGATATAPTATDNCVGSVTATTTDPLSYSVQGTYTIHWTYNDGNGNTSTQNQTVIVDDVTSPVAVCSPLSVTLSNTTGDYTLNAANLSTMGAGSSDNCTSAGNLSFSAMPNNFNCITLGAQAVVLTVNDGNGNNATCNTTVTVNNYVTASAGTDATICDNASVTLTGTGIGGAGTYNYDWTPAATLANPTTSTPTATPSANQTYTLTVTDPFGCSATSMVTISLISAPSAPISGGNKCGFSANSATLDLAVTGTDVEWYGNATHSGTALSTSTTYTATTTGTYYAYEVAGNGCYSNPTALTATIRTNLPTAIPTSAGSHLATDKVVDNGWSHYCDCPNNELLLSLQQGAWAPGDLVNNLNPTSGQYAIRTDVGASPITNLTAAPYNADLTGWQVISRTWDVVLNNAGQEPNANGVASVGVRSYFTQAEFDAVNATFTTPLSSPSKLTVYKLDSITAPTGSLYASSMAALEAGHVGIDKNHIELYNNQTPYLPDWTYIANNVATGIHAAEMSVTEFSGGGGGGGNNGGAPFPISLTKFNGYNENVSNRLFWATESELNADRFIVERSNDNTDFTVVGEVIAVGNSATVQNYSFNDRTFKAKDNFYRLKMLDKDGTFAYSKVIEITTNKLSVTIYPNPAQNEVFIAGNFPANAKVSLSNMLGQEVLNMNLDVNNQTTVPLQNIPQGVYMLNILNEKGAIMHTEKLVKE